MGHDFSRHFRLEDVHNADIDSLLGMLVKAFRKDFDNQKHYQEGEHIKLTFYHACLDRIDLLVTEKNSTATPM